MKPLVFVLSAGRAGTSFVADVMKTLCPEQVEAWHERLKTNAGTRKYYRKYDKTTINHQRTDDQDIANMLNGIRETVAKKSYIDTGWTLHSLFPLFVQEFGTNVRFVLQLRHPFDAAASHVIKGAYRTDWDGLEDWDKHCFLKSSDNVIYSDVHWQLMTPFEKALWRWGELILYWEELKEIFPHNQWHTIKAEKIFENPDEIKLFFDLLEVPMPSHAAIVKCSTRGTKNVLMNDWKYWHGIGREWKKYFQYPHILELAEKYGYDSDKKVIKAKLAKYAKPHDPFGRLCKKIKSIVNSL